MKNGARCAKEKRKKKREKIKIAGCGAQLKV